MFGFDERFFSEEKIKLDFSCPLAEANSKA
jgi:hypothetical protein